MVRLLECSAIFFLTSDQDIAQVHGDLHLLVQFPVIASCTIRNSRNDHIPGDK